MSGAETSQHVKIKVVEGKGLRFRVRVRAEG
jgi:hypothetical protein